MPVLYGQGQASTNPEHSPKHIAEEARGLRAMGDCHRGDRAFATPSHQCVTSRRMNRAEACDMGTVSRTMTK